MSVEGPECAMPDVELSPTGSPSHNAHLFETVTVYYRWHPLFGQSLRVCRRRWKDNTVCQLPDNTALCIPSWMLSPECARLSAGPPQISVDALMQLRHLLSSCNSPPLAVTLR